MKIVELIKAEQQGRRIGVKERTKEEVSAKKSAPN